MSTVKSTTKKTKKGEPVNPDILVNRDGSVTFTLKIDRINSDYDGVKVEGREATYEQRREAAYKDLLSSMSMRECSRVVFTVPSGMAAGYAIGSIVTVTIAKAEGGAK